MSKTKEFFLYEDIGRDGITAQAFQMELDALHAGKGDTVFLRVNSGGGSVTDGFAMYAALKRHPARIIASVDGIAASAASYVIMAANEIQISATAFLMIHHPWTIAAGDHRDFKKNSDDLEKLSDAFAKAYAARSGGKLSVEKARELMDAETWLDAESAVGYGLADTVTEALDMAASVNLTKFGYKNAPRFNSGPGSRRARLRAQTLYLERLEAKKRAANAITRDRLAAMEAEVKAIQKKQQEALYGPEGMPLTEDDFLPGGRGWKAVQQFKDEQAWLDEHARLYH